MVPFLLAAALAADTDAPVAPIDRLIDRFLAAERAFDPVALAGLVTPDYVEVSPLGEVDPHDRFLAFYAPANRKDMPPLLVDERQVRIAGDTAIAIVRLSFTPPGRPQPVAIRATYVARQAGASWRVASAQFTGIRPPAPPAPPTP